MKTIFKIHLPALLLTVFLLSCHKPQDIALNKFSDTVLVKIADFQDRRLSDSLYSYFKNENPLFRRDAVLAFASIQDTLAAEKIGDVLLHDKDPEVRKAAAFALAQTRGTLAFKILQNANAKDTLAELSEALGSVSMGSLILPSGKNSRKAWAYYRYGLQQKTGDPEIRGCIEFLDDASDSVALKGVVHFFSRSSALNNASSDVVSMAGKKLLTVLKNSDPQIRMVAVYALRKIKTDSSFLALQDKAKHDVDYRVRVNAVKALQAFPFEKTKGVLVSALDDRQINVAIAASEVLRGTELGTSWNDLLTRARAAKNWRVQANLYEAVLAAADSKEISEEVRSTYKSASNPYQRAALLGALQQSLMAYGFVESEMFHSHTPVIKSSAAASLVAINHLKKFEPSMKDAFATMYVKAIQTDDPAVIGTIAQALADSTLGYKSVIKDLFFLYEARKKLSLPKDIEAIQPLEDAIAYFEREPLKINTTFNHPIDWALVRSIPANQRVLVKTTKGNITMRLLVDEAPGSVSNFVDLITKKYFDHKIFHRVVPNFVIQVGCNRGDGWGSEDYSIRSEFSGRNYKTGSVGMASAGKDTEGVQWFITHTSTPHLDGRYTIFAEVEDGMNVVHEIEVGDEIVSVELLK